MAVGWTIAIEEMNEFGDVCRRGGLVYEAYMPRR